MGNRPCPRCGNTKWFWADPDLGCNLCVHPDQDPANIRAAQIAAGCRCEVYQTCQYCRPRWNGDPLQGLVCTCTHTLAGHSPATLRCLYPSCPCQAYAAREPYVPRTGD